MAAGPRPTFQVVKIAHGEFLIAVAVLVAWCGCVIFAIDQPELRTDIAVSSFGFSLGVGWAAYLGRRRG